MTRDRDTTTVPFHFRTTIDIRFRDLDALGHVNNAVYFTYFEIARAAYLMAVGRRPLGQDIGSVVSEATCRYRSPAYYGERLIVEVATTSLRSRSFELRYRFTTEQERRLVAEGTSVQVAYDNRTKRSATLDLPFRQAVEQFEHRAIPPR